MPTLTEDRATALKSAEDIVSGAKAANRDLTPDEAKQAQDLLAQVDDLDAKIKAADDSAALMKRLGGLGGTTPAVKAAEDDDTPAPTLGDHFVKHAGKEFLAKRGVNGASVATPEWVPAKANTDTQVTNGGAWSPVLTQIDRTIIHAYRPQPVIADLLGSGTMGANTNAVTYFVEGALEGAFTTVAEGAAKPQLHVVDPTTRTDALKKIAGFLKFTDEMSEDLDFFVSEINQRGLYTLRMFEEQQLLSGNGTGTNVLGLLNRSGIQTGTAVDATDNADAIFRAMTAIHTATGLMADGIVINPTDYQTLRLRKDANGQYYGGGFFAGQYGNNGLTMQPDVWSQRTIVTPAVAAGTVVVGAFQQAATVYRKGGVRVESTNSHASDFTSNLITTRIEERVALAVRYPAAVYKLTLA